MSWFSRPERGGTSKWHARIRVNGKTILLGYYDDRVEAAKAYDAAALEHFGEFAVLNFPGEQEGVA